MSSPMNLTGRNILVTGASSGIGRDTAILLSELGASTVLVGRKEDQLIKTRDLMVGSGHRIEPFDLEKVSSIPSWMKGIAADTGPFDGLVHSAGYECIRPLRLITPETFNNIMNINVNAAIGLTKAFSHKKVNRAGASVVYIASVAGLIGQPGHAEYCASKAALIGVSKALALELVRDGIRVNCIAPGLVQTELVEKAQKTLLPEQLQAIEAYHPLGIGTPRDIAHAVAFLLADTGRWITGTTLVVDGGYTAH